MMEILLPNKYVITSDKYQYILSKYKMGKDKKGVPEMILSDSKYFTSIESVLRTYKDVCIRASDCTTIPEVLKLAKEIDENIAGVMKGV